MATKKVDLDVLADKLKNDTAFKTAFAADPKKAVVDDKQIIKASDDPEVYKKAINALGVAVAVALTGAILLAAGGREVPDVVTALGSAAVGALAGLLAPQKNSGTESA